MKIKVTAPFMLVATFLVVLHCFIPSAVAQISVGAPAQVSLSTSGGTPIGGPSYLPDAGANGSALTFVSDATNLVASDTNGLSDVFYTDPVTKRISKASVTSSGADADRGSGDPSISPIMPDGFYAIAFVSPSTNLGSIPNPSGNSNVYVRFPTLNITEIVSPAVGFTLPNASSYVPSITVTSDANGNKKALVVFVSEASNLVTGDTNGFVDLFLATVTVPTSSSYTPASLTTVTRITNSVPIGQEPDGHAQRAAISADGRYVVFASRASNLVSPPISNPDLFAHMYRYDLQTGTTVLISKNSLGEPADETSLYPEISYTGRFIGYFTFASNIVGSATSRPDFPFVIRYDADTDTNQQVNLAADGVTSGLGQLQSIGLSANGRLVTFADTSGSLVPNDSPGRINIYVKDFETGQVARLSNGTAGESGNQDSLNPTLTAQTLNGLAFNVAFDSLATNLTSPSTATGFTDVYSTVFTLSRPKLSVSTKLETPPDVSIERRKLQVIAQAFALAPTASSLSHRIQNQRRRRAAKREIRYEFSVVSTFTRAGRRRTQRITTITKRNQISVTKIRNGSYAVKNRVRIINARTGRTISKTPFSPIQRFKAT